eukprot:1195820-Pyramimonas_sp.AAC.1
MSEGVQATSYKGGDKFFIDPMKLLPMERFLPQPKGAGGRGARPTNPNRPSSTPSVPTRCPASIGKYSLLARRIHQLGTRALLARTARA